MEKKEMRRIVQNLYEEAEENLTEVALRSTIKNDPNITRRRKELAEGAALIKELGKPGPPPMTDNTTKIREAVEEFKIERLHAHGVPDWVAVMGEYLIALLAHEASKDGSA